MCVFMHPCVLIPTGYPTGVFGYRSALRWLVAAAGIYAHLFPWSSLWYGGGGWLQMVSSKSASNTETLGTADNRGEEEEVVRYSQACAM